LKGKISFVPNKEDVQRRKIKAPSLALGGHEGSSSRSDVFTSDKELQVHIRHKAVGITRYGHRSEVSGHGLIILWFHSRTVYLESTEEQAEYDLYQNCTWKPTRDYCQGLLICGVFNGAVGTYRA
jgi:hypothetical protein